MFVAAVLLDLFKLDYIGVALVAEATFLEGEVAEVAAEGHEDFGVDEGLAIGGIFFFGVKIGESAAADGDDARFERRDAEQTPFGIGNGLGERLFVVGGRGESEEVAVEVVVVGMDVVGG